MSPKRITPVCGTYPSYRKGCRCEPCTATNRERVRAQYRKAGIMPRVLAPCGTKTARARHLAKGEECATCEPKSRAVYGCGTKQARRRHRRKNETCTTCFPTRTTTNPTPSPRKLAPCGTHVARRRHTRKGETCETCGPVGSTRNIASCGTKRARERHRRNNETCGTCQTRRTLQPCGTIAAAKRHRTKGEPVCEDCLAAERERSTHERRARGIPERLSTKELIQEAQFLVNAGEGEARILAALGYTGRPGALRTRLVNARQTRLAHQILNPWDLAA